MPRICITIDSETFNKLTVSAKNKKKSLAQSVRELIAIGITIEEMSAQHEANPNSIKKDFASDDALKTCLKINLRCGVESLYLLRYFIDYSLPEQQADYLATAKQKAETYVEGLFKEQL